MPETGASFLRQTREGVEILVQAQPGAKRSEIVGLHGDRLKIRIQAPPVDGKANEALCEFLAGILRKSRRDVSVASGAASRAKTILIAGASLQDVQSALDFG